MKYRGKYSLRKVLINEQSLGPAQIFDPSRVERLATVFMRKMEESEQESNFPFKLDPGVPSKYNLDPLTPVRIPKSKNAALFDALNNRDISAFKKAYSTNNIKAFTESGIEIEISTPAHLFKERGDGGFSKGGGAQSIGTQYETDAAEYFKGILQKNLEAELQGGSAGASDIGSDNEYYLGTTRDELSPGSNILKMEIKTTAGARFGQMQWGFKVDEKNIPTEFQFRGRKKKEQGAVNQPIADYLNKNLAKLRKDLESVIVAASPNWAEDDLYKMKSGIVGGFKQPVAVMSVPSKMIQDYWRAGFVATRDEIAESIPNIGYNYYKSKGDQFIIVGKLSKTRVGGIYSLDQPETVQLASALGIPSFKEAGTTKVQASYPLERMINMPSLVFSTDIVPLPFPADSSALKKALNSPNEGLRRAAVGFALYIQGTLEGLPAGQINSAIDTAIAVLDAPDAEVNPSIVQDILGDPQANGGEPGTQQNDSKQYNNNLSRLFEWAVK